MPPYATRKYVNRSAVLMSILCAFNIFICKLKSHFQQTALPAVAVLEIQRGRLRRRASHISQGQLQQYVMKMLM